MNLIKKTFYFLSLVLLVAVNAKAEKVYSTPSIIQVSSSNIVVYYQAEAGDALYGRSGDLYAHAGVTTNKGEWQHAPAWGTNTPKYLAKSEGNNVWKLTIGNIAEYYGLAAGETPKKLCFVFRTSTNSPQSADLFLDVQPDGELALSLESSASSPILTDATATVTLTASTTAAADIKIYLGSTSGAPVASKSGATELKWQNTFAVGDYDVIATATAGGKTLTKTLSLCHRGNSQKKSFAGTLKQGATVNASGDVTFCLNAPNKSNVILVGEWDGYKPRASRVMNYQDNKYFWITIPAKEIDKSKLQGYYFIVDDEINVADPYAHLILDPWNDKYINQGVTRYPNLKEFPAELSGTFPIAVFDGTGDGFKWQNNNSYTIPKKENLIVYELLLRDFTTEQSLDAARAKLGHLKSLGVNAVELLPIMEFDGNNSWGYNPNFLLAPDKYYGNSVAYKKFIDTCHGMGMVVILDIVLNHAFGLHPWCMMYWDNANGRPAANNPFFNPVAPHNFSVGNDWRQEVPAVRQYFYDALTYWMEEYHVDGYRFDLAKGLDNSDCYGGNYDGDKYSETRLANEKAFMDAMYAVKPNAIPIFETLYQESAHREENAIAEYGGMSWRNMNYAYRQSANGVQNGSDLRPMYTGYENRVFGSTVGYMESHDEQRLGYDQTKNGVGNLKTMLSQRVRALSSAAAFSLLVPGAKMIWQFGEMGYDISGGNGDTSPKAPHWEYMDIEHRYDLFVSYQELIGIRNTNPDLFAADASFTWNVAQSNWAGGRTLTARSKDGKKELVAVYNPNSASITVDYSFAAGEKYYLSSYLKSTLPSFDTATGKITVPGYSYAVITNIENATSVEDIQAEEVNNNDGAARKVMIDGTLYIEHNGARYSIQGSRVK